MNKSILAACAVVSVCGTTHGFTLMTFGQPAESDGPGPYVEKDITPTSGFIRLAEVLEGSSSSAAYVPEFNGDFGLVTGDGPTWVSRRTEINDSSWFGIDPRGPNGAYTGGTNAANNRPAWNAGYGTNPVYSGFGVGGPNWVGSGDGDNMVTAIDPGAPGWAFAMGNGPDPFALPIGVNSDVSPLGGPSVIDGLLYDWTQSVFVGRITLTDPSAHLQGSFLILVRNLGPPEGFEVNLNGATSLGMRMIQVRDGDSINLFLIEVPAPGALGVMGIAGMVTLRRGRR